MILEFPIQISPNGNAIGPIMVHNTGSFSMPFLSALTLELSDLVARPYIAANTYQTDYSDPDSYVLEHVLVLEFSAGPVNIVSRTFSYLSYYLHAILANESVTLNNFKTAFPEAFV